MTVACSRIGFKQLSADNTGTSSCHLLPPFGRGSDGFCLLRRILFLGKKKRIVDGVFLAGRGGVILGGGQGFASMDLFDKEIMFVLHGYRYRKDGLPGKREEALYLKVENNSGEV